MIVKLNYKEFGEGSPMVILHGLFGMLDNWQTLAKKFAERQKVYIIDQRNHGKSPHTEDFSYDLLAADLEAFFIEHNIEKATVLGHSMGGKTAMRFAKNYPDLVEKLIVVDIAPRQYKGGHEYIMNAILDINMAEIQTRKDADQILSRSIDNMSTRLFLLKNLKRTESGYEWKANFSLLRDKYDETMADFEQQTLSDVATLFIRGGASNYITDADEKLIRQYYNNVKIRTIANAGHWVHAQYPDQLLEMVNEFIN